jgi:hypothetical protein
LDRSFFEIDSDIEETVIEDEQQLEQLEENGQRKGLVRTTELADAFSNMSAEDKIACIEDRNLLRGTGTNKKLLEQGYMKHHILLKTHNQSTMFNNLNRIPASKGLLNYKCPACPLLHTKEEMVHDAPLFATQQYLDRNIQICTRCRTEKHIIYQIEELDILWDLAQSLLQSSSPLTQQRGKEFVSRWQRWFAPYHDMLNGVLLKYWAEKMQFKYRSQYITGLKNEIEALKQMVMKTTNMKTVQEIDTQLQQMLDAVPVRSQMTQYLAEFDTNPDHKCIICQAFCHKASQIRFNRWMEQLGDPNIFGDEAYIYVCGQEHVNQLQRWWSNNKAQGDSAPASSVSQFATLITDIRKEIKDSTKKTPLTKHSEIMFESDEQADAIFEMLTQLEPQNYDKFRSKNVKDFITWILPNKNKNTYCDYIDTALGYKSAAKLKLEIQNRNPLPFISRNCGVENYVLCEGVMHHVHQSDIRVYRVPESEFKQFQHLLTGKTTYMLCGMCYHDKNKWDEEARHLHLLRAWDSKKMHQQMAHYIEYLQKTGHVAAFIKIADKRWTRLDSINEQRASLMKQITEGDNNIPLIGKSKQKQKQEQGQDRPANGDAKRQKMDKGTKMV